jgi:hypothetical protein
MKSITAAIEKNLTQKKFSNWLKRKRSSAYVGRSCESTNCPIARYLKIRTGNNDIEVCNAQVTCTNKGKSIFIRTPVWVNRFIDEIDAINTIRVNKAAAIRAFCAATKRKL